MTADYEAADALPTGAARKLPLPKQKRHGWLRDEQGMNAAGWCPRTACT